MNKLRIFGIALMLGSGQYVFAQSGAGCVNPETVKAVDPNDSIEAIDSLDYVDYSLVGVIKPLDWDRLVLDREQALTVLAHLNTDAYGFKEKAKVKKLLTARNLKLSNNELLGYRKVRSIQVNRHGIFSYPYFACRFKYLDGKLFFEKTAGSQRKSGYVYDNKPDSKVFLGAGLSMMILKPLMTAKTRSRA